MRKPMLVARARKAASEASPRRLREGSATAWREVVCEVSRGGGVGLGGCVGCELGTGSKRGEVIGDVGEAASLPGLLGGFLGFLGMAEFGDAPASSH